MKKYRECLVTCPATSSCTCSNSSRYKVGDSFFMLTLEEVQEHLAASVTKIEEEVAAVEEKLSEAREEMQQLKNALYGRFGRSINLEA